MTATGGTYTLLIELPERAGIEVGALGEYIFEAGWYAYVGSANGTGGFSRVERHRELAAGKRDVRHWHVDYLLGHEQSVLEEVVKTAGVDAECSIAEQVGGDPVSDFGCSDCDCHSHLFYDSDRGELQERVKSAHEATQPGSQ